MLIIHKRSKNNHFKNGCVYLMSIKVIEMGALTPIFHFVCHAMPQPKPPFSHQEDVKYVVDASLL